MFAYKKDFNLQEVIDQSMCYEDVRDIINGPDLKFMPNTLAKSNPYA
jgi:hypothetical protein